MPAKSSLVIVWCAILAIGLASSPAAFSQSKGEGVLPKPDESTNEFNDALRLLTQRQAGQNDSNRPDAEFEVRASVEGGSWEIVYRGTQSFAVSGNRIVIPVETAVDIVTSARDVIYEFDFPKLGLAFDIVPGRIGSVRLLGHKLGIYSAVCRSACSESYWHSPLEIEVVTTDAFDTWRAQTSNSGD